MRRVAVLLGGLALVTLSCQLVLGLEEPVGVNVEVDSGEDPNDPCKHARAPRAPTKEEDSDPGIKNEYWLAATKVTVPVDPSVAGVDLDNLCTCQADLRGGEAPCRTPTDAPKYCDLPNGVDDAFGTQTKEIARLAAITGRTIDPLEPVNVQLRDGIRTLLLYIKDYNGKENDSDVGVAIVNSGGLYSNLGCKGEERDLQITFNDPGLADPPIPEKRRAPANDGCDRWSPVPGVTFGNYPSRVASGALSGYVRDYSLVFRFKEFASSLFGSTSRVTNGVAVVKLRKDGEIFRGTGFIAGRMPFDNLTDLLGRTSVAKADGGSEPFCESSYWGIVSQKLCAARDTMASESEEFQDKTCDAASATIGVDLVQAQVSNTEFQNRDRATVCQSSAVNCR